MIEWFYLGCWCFRIIDRCGLVLEVVVAYCYVPEYLYILRKLDLFSFGLLFHCRMVFSINESFLVISSLFRTILRSSCLARDGSRKEIWMTDRGGGVRGYD